MRAVEPVSLFPLLLAQAVFQKFPGHRELDYPDHTYSQAVRESRLLLGQKSCRDI